MNECCNRHDLVERDIADMKAEQGKMTDTIYGNGKEGLISKFVRMEVKQDSTLSRLSANNWLTALVGATLVANLLKQFGVF